MEEKEATGKAVRRATEVEKRELGRARLQIEQEKRRVQEENRRLKEEKEAA